MRHVEPEYKPKNGGATLVRLVFEVSVGGRDYLVAHYAKPELWPGSALSSTLIGWLGRKVTDAISDLTQLSALVGARGSVDRRTQIKARS